MPSVSAKKTYKDRYKDHFVGYAATIVFLLLAAAFIVSWFYLQSVSRNTERVAYVDTGPLLVNLKGYTVATRLSVQTSEEDAGWAAKNRPALVGVLQQTLAAADPAHMRSPAGLQTLQATLKEAGNQALNTGKIQNVLLTEFVIQTDD